MFALRRKYLWLIKGDNNIFHRHITKILKELEQEHQPRLEDKEDFEQAAKLNLVRLTCRFLGSIFVRTKSKQDKEKIRRCVIR